ncbi:MAG TPA: chemotaxis protein CheW [Candidatus Dormibacteraeota bacterium]|nr:chemotaxis protein CheW [Candidatus Dormibacteraeota bacterium]
MGESVQVATFHIGTEEYGVDISQIQEIIRMTEITHVPRTPDFIEGVINLRGQLIPIIDLRARFGMERIVPTKSTRIIVTDVGTKRVGIVVDSASAVLTIPIEAIEEAPEMVAGVGADYLQGVGKIGDRLVILLDLTMVISAPQRHDLDGASLLS